MTSIQYTTPLSPFDPNRYFMKRLFTVLDNDQDFSVDFKELIFGVSVLCRGSVTQKMKCMCALGCVLG